MEGFEEAYMYVSLKIMAYKFEPACNRMEWLDPFYKQVWQKAFDDAIPISGTFELTPRCNFNCKMCYVHLLEKDIPKYGKELSAKNGLILQNKQRKQEQHGYVLLVENRYCILNSKKYIHSYQKWDFYYFANKCIANF